MEKPRKKTDTYRDKILTNYEHGVVSGWNDAIDAMSTWIEGEIDEDRNWDEVKLAIEPFLDKAFDSFNKDYFKGSMCCTGVVADHIIEELKLVIKRKLTGKDK